MTTKQKETGPITHAELLVSGVRLQLVRGVHEQHSPLRVVAFSSSAGTGAHQSAVAAVHRDRGYVCEHVGLNFTDTSLATAAQDILLRIPLGDANFALPRDTMLYVRLYAMVPSQIERGRLATVAKQDPEAAALVAAELAEEGRRLSSHVWSLVGTAAVPLHRMLQSSEHEQRGVPVRYMFLMPAAELVSLAGSDLKKMLREEGAQLDKQTRELLEKFGTDSDPRVRGHLDVKLHAVDSRARMCERRAALSLATRESSKHTHTVVSIGVERAALPYRALDQERVDALMPHLSAKQKRAVMQMMINLREQTLQETMPGNRGLHYGPYTMDTGVIGLGESFACTSTPGELTSESPLVVNYFENALRVTLKRYAISEQHFTEAIEAQLAAPHVLRADTVMAASVVAGLCSLTSNEVPYHFDGAYLDQNDPNSFTPVEFYSHSPQISSGDCEDTASVCAQHLRTLQRLLVSDSELTPALARARELARHFLSLQVMSTVLAPNMDSAAGGGGDHDDDNAPVEIGSKTDLEANIGGHMYAMMVPLGKVHQWLARAHGTTQADVIMNTLLERGGVHRYTSARFGGEETTTESFHTKMGALGMEGTCEMLAMIGGPRCSLELAADQERCNEIGDYLFRWTLARRSLLGAIGGLAMLAARHTRIDASPEIAADDRRVTNFYRSALQMSTGDFRELAGLDFTGFLVMQWSGKDQRIPDNNNNVTTDKNKNKKKEPFSYGSETRDCIRAASPNTCLVAKAPLSELESRALDTTLPHAGPRLVSYLRKESHAHSCQVYAEHVDALRALLHPQQRRPLPDDGSVRVAQDWRVDEKLHTHLRLNMLFSREMILRRPKAVAAIVRRLGELHEEADVDYVQLHVQPISDHEQPGAPLIDPERPQAGTVGYTSVLCDVLVRLSSIDTKLFQAASESSRKRQAAAAAAAAAESMNDGKNLIVITVTSEPVHPDDTRTEHRVLVPKHARDAFLYGLYHYRKPVPSNMLSDVDRMHAYRCASQFAKMHQYRKITIA